jgi:hypothetical protein
LHHVVHWQAGNVLTPGNEPVTNNSMKDKTIIEGYMEEIRAVLAEQIQKLGEKKISPAKANTISRLAGKIMSNARMELEVLKLAKGQSKGQSKKLAEFEKLAKAKGVTVQKLINDEHRKLVKELEQLRSSPQ